MRKLWSSPQGIELFNPPSMATQWHIASSRLEINNRRVRNRYMILTVTAWRFGRTIWLALISEVIKRQQTSWTTVRCWSTKNTKYEKQEECEHSSVRRSTNCSLAPNVVRVTKIQGIHKRMVRFQKLTRNLFLTLHGHNVHRQQRQLSKFLMRYQQLASHA